MSGAVVLGHHLQVEFPWWLVLRVQAHLLQLVVAVLLSPCTTGVRDVTPEQTCNIRVTTL